MGLLVRLLALCLVASTSALLMPAAPVARAVVQRAAAPEMQEGSALHRKGHVVRVEVELEQNEPCVPHPPCRGHTHTGSLPCMGTWETAGLRVGA